MVLEIKLKFEFHLHKNIFLRWLTSSIAYPNLFEIKDFVVVVVTSSITIFHFLNSFV
jgi:hypothetical protein